MGLGWFLALFCITAITANTAPKFFYTQKHFLPSPTLTQWLLRSQHSKGHRLIPPSHRTRNIQRVIFLTKLPNQPNQQEQRSVDNVHNSGSGSTKHSPMHQSPAANERDDLEILKMVDKDRVAPCEDVDEDIMQLSEPAETAEEECSE